jgi:hypothetical protein
MAHHISNCERGRCRGSIQNRECIREARPTLHWCPGRPSPPSSACARQLATCRHHQRGDGSRRRLLDSYLRHEPMGHGKALHLVAHARGPQKISGAAVELLPTVPGQLRGHHQRAATIGFELVNRTSPESSAQELCVRFVDIPRNFLCRKPFLAEKTLDSLLQRTRSGGDAPPRRPNRLARIRRVTRMSPRMGRRESTCSILAWGAF